jgi:hypothetical protein
VTKIVVRCLTTEGALLGWAETQAAVPGDGHLRASEPVVVLIDVDGECAAVSVHWCDVNVEVRQPLQVPYPCGAGATIVAFNAGDVLIRVGDMPNGLPPVTTKSRTVTVPTGAFRT